MSLVQVIGFQPQVLRTIEWLIKKRRQRLSYGKISRVFCTRNCKCLDFNQCNDLHLNWTSKKHYSFMGKNKSLELELLFLTIKKCRLTLKQRLLQYFTSPTGTRPPLWEPLAELHIHTCLPTLHPQPNFILTSLRITTSNRFSRDRQDVPARTRCPQSNCIFT